MASPGPQYVSEMSILSFADGGYNTCPGHMHTQREDVRVDKKLECRQMLLELCQNATGKPGKTLPTGKSGSFHRGYDIRAGC